MKRFCANWKLPMLMLLTPTPDPSPQRGGGFGVLWPLVKAGEKTPHSNLPLEGRSSRSDGWGFCSKRDNGNYWMKNTQGIVALFSLVILLSMPTGSQAWGTGDYDGGFGAAGDGGCCNVPQALEGSAKLLRSEFEAADRQTLLDRQLLQSICTNHACGELTGEQANTLLARYLDKKTEWARYKSVLRRVGSAALRHLLECSAFSFLGLPIAKAGKRTFDLSEMKPTSIT